MLARFMRAKALDLSEEELALPAFAMEAEPALSLREEITAATAAKIEILQPHIALRVPKRYEDAE